MTIKFTWLLLLRTSWLIRTFVRQTVNLTAIFITNQYLPTLEMDNMNSALKVFE